MMNCIFSTYLGADGGWRTIFSHQEWCEDEELSVSKSYYQIVSLHKVVGSITVKLIDYNCDHTRKNVVQVNKAPIKSLRSAFV